MKAYNAWPAWLLLQGWHGCSRQAVTVIGETPKRYRITCSYSPVRLAGRNRYMYPGESKLVPRDAVEKRETTP